MIAASGIAFTVEIAAMRLEELISIISNGDMNTETKIKASEELDKRKIDIKNINRHT